MYSTNPLTPSTESRSNSDRVLKVLGLVLAIWIAARVVGWLFSPGLLLVALAIWLIVRSQRNEKQQVVYQPAPFAQASNQFTSPFAGPMVTPLAAPMAAPAPMPGPMPAGVVPPKGYWAPTRPAKGSPLQFVPAGYAPVAYAPAGYAPMGYSPVGYNPAGYNPVPFAPLAPAAGPTATGGPLTAFDDPRTPAEKEIEDYIERSWPNV
jgi:hypothetical protein